MALTFGGSVISAIGSVIICIVVFLHWPDAWPDWTFYLPFLIPLCGLFLPTWVMTFVPCICPKCGGKAQLGVVATTASLIPMPRYAWSCTACDWSTYYLSSYQQRSRDAQRRKSCAFFKHVFSFEWLGRRRH